MRTWNIDRIDKRIFSVLVHILLFFIFMIPAVGLAATGSVQFSVSPTYQFGTSGSYLNDGNTYSKIFDGDFTTWWDAPSANGGYAGIDMATPVNVTDVRITPRMSYTSRIFGTQIQAATTSSSTGPWTTLYTIPNFPPFYQQRQYNDIPINTGGTLYRYYRIVPPNGAYGSIAELRFIGQATGTAPYIPVAPVISPLGGKYAQPIQVTIISSTTDATIYYTTDGTTPTFSSGSPQGTTQLYSGAFTVSSSATTTVKAIAVSSGTYVSDVSDPAYFNISPSFKPAYDWYDTTGHLIEGHDGGISYFNGKYYWYGENFNNATTETEVLGIQAYSSSDLLNWKSEGMVLYGSDTYKIRRPHVLYNATTSQYVMWARNLTGRFIIATSSSPTGTFTMATSTYNPSGFGNNDINLFKDTDGNAYVVFTSNDSLKMVIMKLSPDYLSATGTATQIAASASRDAPTIFKRGSVYFMLNSGQNGLSATTVKYSTTTNLLGTWSTLVNPFQPSTEDYTTGYNSIGSDVIQVNNRTDGYVYAGERYDVSASTTGSLYNSRFVWLPITFPTSGSMSVSWQSSWNLDSAFPSNTPPVAASNINVTKVSSSEADITWVNNESTSYNLYLDRASDSGFTQNVRSILLSSSATSYNDTTVSTGNAYYYRVRTVNAAGTANSSTGIANYSAASDVTPPATTLLSPTSGANIIGNHILLSASSSDDIGLGSVAFYVDSTLIGTSTSTSSPQSMYWDSTATSDGAHTLYSVATDLGGNVATSTGVNVNVENLVPTITPSITSVLQNSTTTISLTGNAVSWTAGTPGTPTFTVSGGTGASISSQSISSATSSTIILGAGSATGTLMIIDPSSGASTSISVTADTVAPTVTLISPTNGASVSGTTTLSASSTDNVAVSSIQFKLDSTTNIGSAGTTSPYSISWNTTTASNGSHTIVAVATDVNGNKSTSSVATITVNNSSVPTVTTATSTSISTFGATLNGSITADGGASGTIRGFLYGLTASYGATTTETGTFGIGNFSAASSTLACATTYHYKAYATNLSGTAYGSDKTFTTLTCPVASASGEVQFSDASAYQFGLTPSYLNQGHTPQYVFDNDYTTWWDTNSANGAYVGLDLTVPAKVTRMEIAPRIGYTARVYGAILQGSNGVSTSSGPWTNIYTIQNYPPYYDAARQMTTINVDTGTSTYRYYRLLMANGTNGTIAEFHLIGQPGTTTPYVPVTPTMTPTGGRYDEPTLVHLSSLTTDATMYYTTDGSVPTFSNGSPQGSTQLYSGPFLVNGTGTTTVRAIAVSQNAYVSSPSDPVYFNISTDMRPAQNWYDTSTSHLIESHDGGILYANGKYYWYGQIFNASDPENESVGISVYSSPDLINWKDEGPIVYLGRTYLLERPHVIYNDTTHKYVMWAHNIISYPNSRAYVAYSDTPTGPFTVATSTLNPDGMGLNDMNLFKDTDGTAYVIYSNGTNTQFVISKLSADYLSTSGTYITPSVLVNHEGPAMFKRGNVYYLMMSGVTGWPPNLNKYSTSTSVLGTWSTPVSPFQTSATQNVNTSYDSQTTDVLTVQGRNDAYVYMGDRNDDSNYQNGSLYNSRHIWLPMVFDSSGNMSISWSDNWNLNTAFTTSVAPAAATNLAVTVSGNQANLSWTNNATTSFSLFMDRATDSTFTQNVVSDVLTSTTTSYTDTYNFNSSTHYYYRIRTLTGAGTSNSAVATSFTTTVDVPPAPTLSTASDSGISSSDNVTNNVLPTLQGTASSSATVYVVGNVGTIIGTTTAAGDGSWSFTPTASSTPDGTYDFSILQQVGGTMSATSSTLAVTVDTTAPMTSLSSTTTSPTNAAFVVTASSSESIYGLSASSFLVTNGSISSFATTSSSTFNVLVTPTSTGTTTVSLPAHAYTDVAGNFGSATSTFSIYADVTAPTLSTATIDGANLSLTFTKTLMTSPLPSLSDFAVIIDGVTTTPSSLSISTSTVYLVLSSAVHSVDAVKIDYTSGTHPLADIVGNQVASFADMTVTNGTVAIVPDTLPVPNLATSSDSGVSDSDNLTRTTRPVLSGVASSSALIALYRDDDSLVGTTTSALDGSWSYQLPNSLTPDGFYSFKITQTLYGITSATSSLLTIQVDTTAPVVSITTPANNSTVQTWSPSVSWDDADTCEYSLDAQSFSQVVCNGLSIPTPSVASHTLVLKGSDLAGNVAYATSTFTYAPDVTIPSISAVSITPSDSSATITWTTSKNASTQVLYGLDSTVGNATAVSDTSTRVTSHSVTLSSLVPCTLYHYQLKSIDASANVGTTSDAIFLTTGCSGSAPVTSTTEGQITTASGGSVSLDTLTLTVPTGFTSTSSLTFQVKKLDSDTFFDVVGTPTNMNRIGSSVINLKALEDTDTIVSSFDVPLTVEMTYVPSDISGIDENSLKIYRYDGSAWHVLQNCSVDTGADIVTCQTSSFSDFALFGTAAVVQNNNSDVGLGGFGSSFTTIGNITYMTRGGVTSIYSVQPTYNLSGIAQQSTPTVVTGMAPQSGGQSGAPSIQTSPAASASIPLAQNKYTFTRDLSLGSIGIDVKNLQIYLNAHGFSLAVSGPGSKGHETAIFATLTRNAVARFQAKMGIKPSVGYFGPLTRAFVNSH